MDCALSLYITGITNESQRLKKINLKVFGWGGNKEVQEIEPIRVAARMPA
jgi:hypothetical protein